MKQLTGVPASDGIAIGPVFVYSVEVPPVERRQVPDPALELQRFDDAVTAVTERLIQIEQETKGGYSAEDFEILEVQRMLLNDDEYGGVIRTQIETERVNAEAAVELVTQNLALEFSEVEDDYFSQRAADIRDIGGRLLRTLANVADIDMAHLDRPVIVYAHDLTPSDTISFDPEKILGLCTETGSATSHTAILARSLGVPAVVGVGAADITDGEEIVIDGGEGLVLVAPTQQVREQYEARMQQYSLERDALIGEAHEPAVTMDGCALEVVANVGSVVEAERAVELGAEGIGLLRTEFLFLERRQLPSESEQYEIYRKVADLYGDKPVIVRTLDVGGDKQLPSVKLPHEQNPFLGHRAIRLCLERTELFQTQLRALLRAGFERNILIMLPFVSTVPELKRALEQVEAARETLRANSEPYNPETRVGIMIEIPSAAVMADKLAPYVDFFSIGTNDLCQYTLAADRTNEQVAHIASPFDPAILRLIHMTIEAGHAHGKWVGMCGEMAGNQLALPLLLGLKLDEFSMAPAAVPAAKHRLRTLSQSDCVSVARQCLDCEDADAVRAILKGVRRGVPEDR